MKARNLARLSSSLGFAVACIGVALSLSRSGHAQSEPFYRGKTVRIIVGSTPRRLLRPLGQTAFPLHPPIYCRQPQLPRAEYAGRELGGCRQLRLQSA
jgi:hypothetical protein